MKLYIKYMVSLRCKLLVKQELANLGIKHAVLELGMVEILEDVPDTVREQLKISLKKSGLELLDDVNHRTAVIGYIAFMNCRSMAPVAASHASVQSEPVVTIERPSGVSRTAFKPSLAPSNRRTSSPVAASHSTALEPIPVRT